MLVIDQDRAPKIFAIFGKNFLNFKIFFSSKNHFYKVDFQKKIFFKSFRKFFEKFFWKFFSKNALFYIYDFLKKIFFKKFSKIFRKFFQNFFFEFFSKTWSFRVRLQEMSFYCVFAENQPPICTPNRVPQIKSLGVWTLHCRLYPRKWMILPLNTPFYALIRAY